MCMRPVKIKAISPNAPRICYVPCGTCKDCRNAYKSQWQIRLSTELVQRQKDGWYVGFVTLTYDDEHLPHVPDCLLMPECSESVPCFSREHIRKFIVDIRRDLDEFWNIHGLVYMVCAEYGSHTRRPHYHCIFSWPKDCKPIEFWSLLQKYWSYGFLIPKDINGGRDRHGRIHKPFLVSGSARYAGIYASKYTCKDLDFAQDVRGKVNTKDKLWKQFNCFHCQSRSLGLTWLQSKSDSELRDLFFNGLSFNGDLHRHQLPVYFRNKILFSPYYVLERKVYKGITLQKNDDLFMSASDSDLEEQGYRVVYRRLVRRKCTSFFFEHRKEIFDKRVAFWSDSIRQYLSDNWLESKGLDSVFATRCRSYLSSFTFTPDSLATWIVARHGLPRNKQYICDDLDIWYTRYELNEVDSFENCPLYDSNIVDYWSGVADFFLSTLSLIYSEESDYELYIKRLQDKLKSGGY